MMYTSQKKFLFILVHAYVIKVYVYMDICHAFSFGRDKDISFCPITFKLKV